MPRPATSMKGSHASMIDQSERLYLWGAIDNPITNTYLARGSKMVKAKQFKKIDEVVADARALFLNGSMSWSDLITNLQDTLSMLQSDTSSRHP